MVGNLPKRDLLSPDVTVAVPQRSLADTRTIEDQKDTDKVKTVPVTFSNLQNRDVISYDASLGKLINTPIGAIASTSDVTPIQVNYAAELRNGPSSVRAGASDCVTCAGDWIFSPGAIQRVDMLVIPEVGSSQAGSVSPWGANVTLTAAITTTTQTVLSISTGVIANGDGILIDNEAMRVVSGGLSTTITVQRAQMRTTAATHANGASVRYINVESVMHVYGGMRAVGGVATSDVALHGDTPSELVVRRTYRNEVMTFAGAVGGRISLIKADHSHTTDTNYRVEIQTAGPPGFATFRWSDDGGATWDASDLVTTTAIYVIGQGVEITFSYGVFQVGDRLDFTAIAQGNQVELMRADTRNDVLNIRDVFIGATTSEFTTTLTTDFHFTGTASGSRAGILSLFLEDTSAAGITSGYGLQVTSSYARGAGGGVVTTLGGVSATLSLSGLPRVSGVTAGRIFEANSLLDNTATAVSAYYVSDIGASGTPTVTGLDIAAQTIATTIYNIRQRGTTGVNRLAAPTLIGADASPAAGVALELRSGRLRMAASTNDYIEDSAGNRHLTFASSSTAVSVTSTFAGSLRVNGQGAIGTGISSNIRLSIATWVNLGAGSHSMLSINVSGAQSAGATRKSGFAFAGSYDLNSTNLTNFDGLFSQPDIQDAGATATLSNYAAYRGGFSSVTGGLGPAAITNSAVYWAIAPTNTNATPITTHRGLYVENQGDGNITTNVGVDIATQSGSGTVDIGLRLNANFYELSEMTAPAAPAANGCRIWVEDNGSGKTRLMALFSSGAAQQIAIQP